MPLLCSQLLLAVKKITEKYFFPFQSKEEQFFPEVITEGQGEGKGKRNQDTPAQ